MKCCLNDYRKGACSINDAAYDVSGKLSLPPGAIDLIPSRLNAEAIVKMLKEGFDFSRLSQGFSDLTKKLQLDLLLIDTHPALRRRLFSQSPQATS
jgi:MinD-like ATPase involved in chromosome partitioning or flagellar assembly